MEVMVFRGVGKLFNSAEIQTNVHERASIKFTLGMKDLIILLISNFTKLWQLEEIFAVDFTYFCIYNFLYKK